LNTSTPTQTPTPTVTPIPTPTPLAFAPAREDEILILIASFHRAAGTLGTEPHNEIKRAIQEAADELEFSNLRVEVEPTDLATDDQAAAEDLGRQYGASMVIWGSETGVRVSVSFLNLRQPDLDVSKVRITETERTQIFAQQNPEPYAQFITQDMPGQIAFLSLFAIGQSYYVEEEYAESRRTIERAISALSPGSEPEGLAEAHYRLGWLYQVPPDGVTWRAIEHYDQAIALNADYAKAYNNRGIAHATQGDLDLAMADFDQAISLMPSDATAFYNRGLVRHREGELAKAMADYNRGIRLDPGFGQAYTGRGLVRAAQGDLDAAIADFNQAIQISPNDAVAYNGRGLIRDFQGDRDGASADFARAVELDPRYAEAQINLGSARARDGDVVSAVVAFDATYLRTVALPVIVTIIGGPCGASMGGLLSTVTRYEADGSCPSIFDVESVEGFGSVDRQRALQHYICGVESLESSFFCHYAIEHFELAMESYPDYAEAYNGRGVARYAMDDVDGAIADFERAITLDPSLGQAYNNRGCIRYEQGDLAGARSDFTTAIELAPHLIQAYPNRAVVLADLGYLLQAVADFDRLVDVNPDLVGEYARPSLGRAYALRGLERYARKDLDGAEADFGMAAELDPEHAEDYYNRSLVRYAQGDVTGAFDDYLRVLELAPELIEVLFTPGMVRDGLAQPYADRQSIRADFAQIYNERAHDSYISGYPRGATIDSSMAIALDPSLASAYYTRGNAYEAQGKMLNAISDYGRAIQVEPDCSACYEARGSAYRTLGYAELALADLRRYLELQPDSENRQEIEEWIAALEAEISEP
jgi:tetratricopeptide (TPR) repeat protein